MLIVRAVLIIVCFCITSCEDIFKEDFKIVRPNGGEVFVEGNEEKIKWTGPEAEINISYDGGKSWDDLGWYYESSPYEYRVRKTSNDLDSCLIKLISEENDTLISENFFSIKADSNYVLINYPIGGEQFATGDEVTITWDNFGDAVTEQGRWRVYISLNDADYEYIDYVYGYNKSQFTWEVPEIFYPSEARMRLVYFYYNDNGISYSDTSNSFFLPGNLQSPIIEILNPNGGEIFQEQSLTGISWFSTGDIGGAQVHIGYSLNGGATWFDALNNDDETSNPPRYGGWNNAYYSWNSVDNSGSYEWTLPSIVDTSSGCLLGIWSVSNNNIYKTSQNAFTINSDSNFYRIISPNGDGEIFQKQKYHIISWEEGGDVDNVDLYYSIFAGNSWYPLADYDYEDGSVIWKVPSIQGTNDACKIKIVSRTNPNWYDVSDVTFTISDTVQFSDNISFESNESLADWNFDTGWVTSDNEAFEGQYSIYIMGSNQEATITKYVQSGIFSFYFLPYNNGWSNSHDLFLKIEGGPSDISEERLIHSHYGNSREWINYQEFIELDGTYTFTWQNGYYGYLDAVHFP